MVLRSVRGGARQAECSGSRRLLARLSNLQALPCQDARTRCVALQDAHLDDPPVTQTLPGDTTKVVLQVVRPARRRQAAEVFTGSECARSRR